MAAEVSCKNLKAAQNESIVESTDSEERSETSVEVKAQVMKRGDAGWVPIDGGGLSVVGLSTYPVDDNSVEEVQYRVNARRVKDNASLLSCILKKDLAYTKGNPLFHHWQTQGQKFGLTFHSSTDACTFEQWICNAKHNLLGSNSNCEKSDQACEDLLSQDAILAARLVKDTVSLPGSRARTPSPGASNRVTMRHSSILLSSYPSSYPALHSIRLNTRDDQVKSGGRRSATCALASSRRKSRLCHDRPADEERGRSVWIRREDLSVPEFSAAATADGSYVQFSRSDLKANCNNFNIVHEYFYPTLGSPKRPRQPEPNECPRERTDVARTSSRLGAVDSSAALRLPKKGKKRRKAEKKPSPTSGKLDLRQLGRPRRRCSRCRELYVESADGGNPPSRCPYGSDGCLRCIELSTCVTCARALLYHLASDEDGDYGRPCSCDDGHQRSARKWLVLALISIFLPCFWCYAPLEGCRRCCVRRGNCGSGHKSE